MPSLRSSLTTASRENNENVASNKRSSVQVSQSNDQTGQSSSSPPSSVSSDQARGSGIKLALPWNTRDHIIIRLSQFSKLLFGQSVSEEVNVQAVKQTNSLMTALIGLASSDVQTGGQERSMENVLSEERPKKKARVEKKAKKSAQIDESGESNATRPFFLIPLRLRREVIDQLVRNMDAVCYSTGSLDESSRNRLREQNDHLNLQLLSLSVTLMNSTSADESDQFELPSNLDIDLNKRNRKLDQTVTACQSELSTLTSEFRSLRESVEKLETSVQRLEATNSEITMNYELTGVESFFSSTRSKRYSKTHMCGGCPWSIRLDVNEQEEGGQMVKYLGFFVRCERPTDANEQWSIGARYDLILLSPSNSVVKQLGYDNTFKWTDKPPSFGTCLFISYDSLKRNNYIQNDRIKVRVELKCDQLVIG